MTFTPPTDAQIEADLAKPTFNVELYEGGSWVDYSADVIEIGTAIETASGSDGIGFGVGFQPSADIKIAAEAFSVTWDRKPVRIRYGFEGNNPLHFVGLIDGLSQNYIDGAWAARGFDAILEAKEIRSPLFYRRPVATLTTTTSIENPASAGYSAGLINYILWMAGGRPWAQITTYPSAPFYYDCEAATLAPDWSWVNGGNAAKLIQDLCSAAGGLLYQDTAGIVRYVEPYSLANAAPSFHYTDTPYTQAERLANSASHYGEPSRRGYHDLTVTRVRCNFIARRLQGVKQLYSDTTPRQVEAGETITIPIDLTLPCYRLDRVNLTAGTLHTAVEVTPAQLTVTVTATYAQRIEISVTNTLTETIAIYAIKAHGQPLEAMEEGSATYGTDPGDYGRELAIPDSPFIQSRTFAERLCRLYHDFYSTRRDVVTLAGCGFDPRRQIGEIVNLTCSRWNLAAVPHRIIAIRVSFTGIGMELDMVPVDGLPVGDDFFQLGGVYADSTELQLIP